MQGSEELAENAAAEPGPHGGGPAPADVGEEAPFPLHETRDWRPAADAVVGAPVARMLGLSERELPGRWEGEPTILAVTSGKGGVGKSNLSASLALLLAAAGTRVALIDGNLGLGDLDVLLGVEARAALGEVITGRRSLREVMIRLPWGADFAGGGLGGPPGRMLDPLRRLKLIDQVAALREDYDLVIVDCNAGAGGEVMEFCGVADRIFVVTTPEPPAVASAYGLLKVLARKGHLPKVAVVVNAAGDRSEAEETYRRIGSVARQFLGAEIADGGYVLEDPAVAHAVRRRRPFLQAYPRCDASRSLAALAARVLPTAERAAAPIESGLLGRILGYLD